MLKKIFEKVQKQINGPESNLDSQEKMALNISIRRQEERSQMIQDRLADLDRRMNQLIQTA